MKKSRPTKAVIAAAGLGTRFLPQTKAMPKEMLPLIDKPIIQYIVEELVEAGIKDIIIVTGYSKRNIEDHFDSPNQELVANLQAGGEDKKHMLHQVDAIANMANFIYVRQKGPYGNASPLTSVAHLVGDEPFIYTYADDLIPSKPNRFEQMASLYEELGGAIYPCIRITNDQDFTRYGIVGGKKIREGVLKMDTIAEKPGRKKAPSDLASVGGYLLTPEIFPYLEEAAKHLQYGTEFMVQPAMQKMLEDGKQMFACELKNGKYHDTGNKLEYLKTVVDFALQREDIGGDFRKFLEETVCKLKS